MGKLWQNPIDGPAFDSKFSTYQDNYKQFIEDLMDLNSDTGKPGIRPSGTVTNALLNFGSKDSVTGGCKRRSKVRIW